MGFYDTLHCEYPLPDSRHQDLDFQTKSLDPCLLHYKITHDGRLVRLARPNRSGPDQDVEWPIHGDITFYTSVEKTWIEYVARFTDGRIEWIRPIEEARPSLDNPPPGAGWSDLWEPIEDAEPEAEPTTPTPDAGVDEIRADVEGQDPPPAESEEEALLRALRRERPELEKLLQKCSDHWGYEDQVYRFYHQSFKVYGLQQSCQAIVGRLQALAPDRPLHPWFVEIVRAGTGKAFQMEDNERWLEVTRPILEAFFHARFFLEMAVRYGDLDAPPSSLPSGYAALLVLFGLR
jgi:hypothetical protein